MSVFKRKFSVKKQVIHPDAPDYRLLVVLVFIFAILAGALALYDWRNALVGAIFYALGVGSTILVLRHRLTFHHIKTDIQPMTMVQQRLFDEEDRLVGQSVSKSQLKAETIAEHRDIVRKYRRLKQAKPDLADEFIIPELAVEKTTLYAALQNWRLGYLDDRSWYHQAWDRLTGRWYDDETRYL